MIHEEFQQHVPWPKIGSFAQKRRNFPNRLCYRPKVKIHGSNAAIRVDNDRRIVAQSRNRDLTPEDDNFGFAMWVQLNEAWVKDIIFGDDPFVIFGEWAGRGVIGGTSASQAEKFFAVFHIQRPTTSFSEPAAIRGFLSSPHKPDNVHVIPWYSDSIRFANDNPQEVADAVELINSQVAAVDLQCPFGADVLGVDGPGEGLVYYQVEGLRSPMFKAKGDTHSVKKQKKPATVDPAKYAAVSRFVADYATEARFEQGAREIASIADDVGVFDMRNTGAFLKWVGNDIRSESEHERVDLPWKDCAKQINAAALKWWKERAD